MGFNQWANDIQKCNDDNTHADYNDISNRNQNNENTNDDVDKCQEFFRNTRSESSERVMFAEKAPREGEGTRGCA